MRIKTRLWIISVAGVCLFSSVALAGTYGGGTGEVGNPYQIWTDAHLNSLGASSSDWGKHFKLMSNISMSAYSGTLYKIIGGANQKFTGSFEGQGYLITNLNISQPAKNGVGLFGYIGESGVIKNLGVPDAVIVGADEVGGLAGNNEGSVINCYSSGNVSGQYEVGGLIGWNSGQVECCYSVCTISGQEDTGGLIGDNFGKADIVSSFYEIPLNPQADSKAGRGLSSEQMSRPSVYANAGWADRGWVMNDSNDLPHFSRQDPAGLPIPQPLPIPLTGSGSSQYPYQIQTAHDFAILSWYSSVLDANLIVTSNIDLSTIEIEPIGVLGRFKGHFDGQGYTISNADMNRPDCDCVGLFGFVGSTATVRNVTIADANMIGHSYVGGLAGYSEGTIETCSVSGTIQGHTYVGGLAGGGSTLSSITSCVCDTAVTGDMRVGGLIGWNNGIVSSSHSTGSVDGRDLLGGLAGVNSGSIASCYSHSSVHSNTDYNCLGGLVGNNATTNSSLTNCYSSGSVTGGGGDSCAGGLVGINYGTVLSCRSSSAVYSETNGSSVGGLIGLNQSGSVASCYAEGAVGGVEFVGGITGINADRGQISYSYSSAAVEAINTQEIAGGLVGMNFNNVLASFWDTQSSNQLNSAGGYGLPTDEMKAALTYAKAGWQDMHWVIADGADYPRLDWENGGQSPIPAKPPIALIGNGSDLTPYQVWTAADLSTVMRDMSLWDKQFDLMADLNLNEIGVYPIGAGRNFTGRFDGNGYAIKNLNMYRPACDRTGLFGRVGAGGIIENLGIENAAIVGCDYTGGIAGINKSGSLTNCYFTGTVSGLEYTGGLVGEVGSAAEVKLSYAKGAVTGTGYVGGLVGSHSGAIRNCYSRASAEGTSYVGGLVGYNIGVTITNSYCTGAPSGSSSVGGLVGYGSSNITASFWDTQTSGTSDGVGNVNPDPAGVMGKTTAQMKTQSTFTGWDFAAKWAICQTTNYPRLRWQIPAGDFACPDGAAMEDFALLSLHWLETNAGEVDLTGNGIVNIDDLMLFCENWLEGV